MIMNRVLIMFLVILISSCSNVEVYPLKSVLVLQPAGLAKQSGSLLKDSAVDESVPSEKDKKAYYDSLVLSGSYRQYLLLECAQLLHNEHGLLLDNPIYVTAPNWNNFENF